MGDFSWPDPPVQSAFPIARAGYPLITWAGFATAVFALLGWQLPALAGLVATFCIGCFFRDPDRVTPNDKGAVVSPADGKVIIVEETEDQRFCSSPCWKISVFMSVFNVHVNRVPHGGTVKKIDYSPGKFINASFDKASTDNERNAVFLEVEPGKTICFVQIAGLIARRIISGLQVGDRVVRGQRFGMICFGSRLDIYLPRDTKVDVSVGDKVRAGATILGYLT